MKRKNIKGTRIANPVTAVLLAGLLCALPPIARAQFFGGFGGATSLAGAATLAGATTLAGPASCGGPTTLAAGSTLAAGTAFAARSVGNGGTMATGPALGPATTRSGAHTPS